MKLVVVGGVGAGASTARPRPWPSARSTAARSTPSPTTSWPCAWAPRPCARRCPASTTPPSRCCDASAAWTRSRRAWTPLRGRGAEPRDYGGRGTPSRPSAMAWFVPRRPRVVAQMAW